MNQAFIQVKGRQFERNGRPYFFLGTNFWYGMNLASQEQGGDRARLLRELDRLQALGINNLRVMAASEGPDTAPWRMLPSLQPVPGIYNEALMDGLDFLLAEMGKREMFAVVCLNNFWPWSGGMAQYLDWFGKGPIPYPMEGASWAKYALFASKFYKNSKAKKAYLQHIRWMLSRTNAYTGIPYTEDPAIMSWQLANEPRGMLKSRAYRKWITEAAALIKSLDTNHLISIGSEGKTATILSGTRFVQDHCLHNIDYATFHLWVQNWGWYDPSDQEKSYPKGEQKALEYLNWHLEQAQKLNMPLVLEEFGISRDWDDHQAGTPVKIRDRYYRRIFEEVYQQAQDGERLAGCNFWAWGGEGRPREAGEMWQEGDEFTGDPPHERQGWYSVYEDDTSTLEVITEFAEKMNGIS